MATVGEARIDVTTEGAGEAQNALSAVGGALSTLGGIAVSVAGVGLAALAGGLKFAVDEAMDSQVAMAGLNAVLNSTHQNTAETWAEMNKLAASLQNTTRFSDEMAMSAEAMLLRFENIGQDVFPQALSAAADLASAMGTDLTAAAQAVGRALDNPAEGIGRLNQQFKLFNKEQLTAIQEMAEAGDVAGAQAMILEALNQKVGGTAEAMGDTLAGRIDIFKNKLSDLGETIGFQLLPHLDKLFDGLDFLFFALQQGMEPLAAFDEAMRVAGLGGVMDFINTLGTQLAPAFANLGESLGTIGAQLSIFWEAHGEEILAAVSFTFGAIVSTIAGALEFVAGLVAAITAAMNGDWSGAMDALENGASGALDTIAGIFGSSGAEIAATWAGVGEQIGIIANGIATKIIGAITGAIAGAIAKAKEAVKIGQALVDGIASAISGGASAIVDALVGAVMAAVQAAMAAAGIASPSKLAAAQIGLPIIQGVAAGIAGGAQLPAMALSGAVTSSINNAQTHNNFNLNIHTNAPREPIEQDFNMMKAWAGS